MDSIPTTTCNTSKEQILFTKNHRINRTMPTILSTSRKMPTQTWTSFCDEVDAALQTLLKKKIIVFIGWIVVILFVLSALFYSFGASYLIDNWDDTAYASYTTVLFPVVAVFGTALYTALVYINYAAHYKASSMVQKACVAVSNWRNLNKGNIVTVVLKGAYHGNDEDNYVGDEDIERIENEAMKAIVVFLKRSSQSDNTNKKTVFTNWFIEVAVEVDNNNDVNTIANDLQNGNSNIADGNNNNYLFNNNSANANANNFGDKDIDVIPVNDALVSSYGTPSFLEVKNGSAEKK